MSGPVGMTALKAARRKCLQCTCDSPNEVKRCPIPACALFPWRFGHRPSPDALEAHVQATKTESENEVV